MHIPPVESGRHHSWQPIPRLRAPVAAILFSLGWALIFSGCSLFVRVPEHAGVVRFFDDIPGECSTTAGIKQPVVRRVTSETELRRHYGLTFRVHFNDNVSPPLYGTLYYQNRERNLYCMALPDGRFATFHDSQITETRRNVMQEVCYPLQDCSEN